MTRYEQLGDKLDDVLERKRTISTPDSRYGMTPAKGKEAEWDRLDREAEEIRREMRRVRYGSE